MAVDKSLISGSTTMLILQLLEEKDMYGYEMIETLQKKSQNVFQLKAGTLYPLLHTLEGKGYLTSYEDSTGQKVRKYYSITKSGKNFLSQKKEEWKEYSAAVANILTSRLTGSADVISSYVPPLEGCVCAKNDIWNCCWSRFETNVPKNW